MTMLSTLHQHADDILRAELAGLLHNIGKLDANFLVQIGVGQAKAQLDSRGLTIPDYRFKHVATPSANVVDPTYQSALTTPSILSESGAASLANPKATTPKDNMAAAEFNEAFRLVPVLSPAQAKFLATQILSIGQEQWAISDLLPLFWDDFMHRDNRDEYKRRYALAPWLVQADSILPILLILAHGEVSGSEKGVTGLAPASMPVQSRPKFDQIRIATPFGYETKPNVFNWVHLRNQCIDALPPLLAQGIAPTRHVWTATMRSALRHGLGDTQRPINEITLWDYASSIAALFKASIAKSVIEGKVADANDLKFRFLSMRLDGMAYRFQAQRVADLIGRSSILEQAFGVIREQIETASPLGGEVYHDEDGLLFVAPDLTDDVRKTLKQELSSAIGRTLRENQIDDVAPVIDLSEPLRGKRLNLGDELKRLGEPQASNLDAQTMAAMWGEDTQTADICTVCGVRPQGYMPPGSAVDAAAARERNICGVCLDRRLGRARGWSQNRSGSTIWTDEISDDNGRLALIVGQFDLDHWLDGTLIESLSLGRSTETKKPVPKYANFARVRRIWETTERFWRSVEDDLTSDSAEARSNSLRDSRRRLILSIANAAPLKQFNTYELAVENTRLSVLWDGAHLISIDNLGYVAAQLGVPVAERRTPADAVHAVGEKIDAAKNKPFRLHRPAGEGDALPRSLPIAIAKVDYEDTDYARIIPVLKEPRTYMAFLPGDKAIDAANAIRQKYEREFGKVRNRLPLHVGVVFFPRNTPLAPVLTAGRQMLEAGPNAPADRLWAVAAREDGAAGGLPGYLTTDGGGQFNQAQIVHLESGGQKLRWCVPTRTDDGATADEWYPYAFVQSDDPAKLAAERKMAFVGDRPTAEQTTPCALVHVAELQVGDQVFFSPSTFDFEFLDTTGRRFDIRYGDDGRRMLRATRPYFLDDLPRLDSLWTELQHLAVSQRYQLVQSVDAARLAWQAPLGAAALSDGTLTRFAADTLAGAAWPSSHKWRSIDQEMRRLLTEAAATGELTDVLELRMQINRE